VSFAGERMSYRQLEQRSNQLARYLQQHGVSTGAMVGICLERSAELVVAILAVVKAGAAYVPMDPDYPEQRLQHMAEDAGLKLIISQNNVAGIVAALPVTAVNLDAVASDVAQLPATAPEVQLRPEDLAYVIFTSGSTGRPKGVMNEHRGIVNRLLWMQDEYQLSSNDRVLQKTPFSFDVSVWEFFWPLISGAELVVAKPGGHRDAAYLAETIKVEQITTLHFVPSMLQIFLQNASSAGCSSLQRVICSGEALPFDVQRRFFDRFGHAGLHNLYGPTEAAIDVTYWPCARNSAERSVPIGRPVANTRLYIVDAHGQRTALGVPGELWISGVQVARGYVSRDELTAERFIADPFNPGSRVYRTGDLARFRDDGAVEFLGRIDHQVKLRGFRIELGEIEAVLDTCSDVDQSVVLLREDVPGLPQLVAYVARADLQFDKAAAQEVLAAELPDYMLPGAYVVLPDLPVTPNGKIDRRALPAPEAPQSTEEYVAPRNPLETEVAQIWAELLGVDQVGLRDDFFALGGHSLIAMQLVSRIAASKGVQLPIDSVFITPTLEALCASIAQSGKTENNNISTIRRSSRRKPST
jgi:amino acid adenylation domain-containing protein